MMSYLIHCLHISPIAKQKGGYLNIALLGGDMQGSGLFLTKHIIKNFLKRFNHQIQNVPKYSSTKLI